MSSCVCRVCPQVNFNEPLSMLQRMMEEMLYANILDTAAASETTLEELTHVVAYSTACYAHTTLRVGKPFNPLLGETYECDRRVELGWRCLLEQVRLCVLGGWEGRVVGEGEREREKRKCDQRGLSKGTSFPPSPHAHPPHTHTHPHMHTFPQVSHHPPMFAMHVEHKEWTLWQEYTVASKFRGKYLMCYPIGSCHLMFHRSKSHYTWCKVATTIHNIIVGKLWVDQVRGGSSGVM